MTDSNPDRDKRQHKVLARLSPEERLRLAMAWSNQVRDLAWAGFRRRHTGIPEERLPVMFLRELYGIDMPEPSGRQGNE